MSKQLKAMVVVETAVKKNPRKSAPIRVTRDAIFLTSVVWGVGVGENGRFYTDFATNGADKS